MYTSETSRVRASLSKWCSGYGVDLGHGGDKILPRAIAIDLHVPHAETGTDPVQLGGDAALLPWFRDEVLDFVYSSHLLEDFHDTVSVVNEWARVLKFGGYLVLYLPDEQIYQRFCAQNGTSPNAAHKHPHFGASYVKNCISKGIYNLELVHESKIINHYSFELVYKKYPFDIDSSSN
jgi:predicted SAM-dependent methyltransferase